jgi:hypothetical protein
MNTNKAAYWIAIGVLALGLHSEYRHGGFVGLHRVVEFADSALCQIASHAERTLAVAKVVARGKQFPAGNLVASTEAAEIARAQGELLREQMQDTRELLRDRVRDQVRQKVRDQIRSRADVIRAQTEIERATTEIERATLDQIRSHARPEFRFASMANPRVTVICPKAGASRRTKIVASSDIDLAEVSPYIEVEDSF